MVHDSALLPAVMVMAVMMATMIRLMVLADHHTVTVVLDEVIEVLDGEVEVLDAIAVAVMGMDTTDMEVSVVDIAATTAATEAEALADTEETAVVALEEAAVVVLEEAEMVDIWEDIVVTLVFLQVLVRLSFVDRNAMYPLSRT